MSLVEADGEWRVRKDTDWTSIAVRRSSFPGKHAIDPSMISVIFVTRDEQERLLRSLAALTPFALEGIVSDVVVADLGSRDATLEIADAAGCAIVEDCPDLGAAIGRAAVLARKDWLLRLAAGDIVEVAAAEAALRHIAQAGREGEAGAAAYLACAKGGALRRAAHILAFDMLGLAPFPLRRVLAPRTQAHLLDATGRRWPGTRLKARIERSE